MPVDLINRGEKKAAFWGTTTFVGLRVIDPFIQHSILARGSGTALIEALGSATIAMGPTSNTGSAFIDNLGLSPYRLILFGMTTAASVKQILWKLFIGEEYMSPGASALVGVYNTLFNAANNLLFICRATSAGYGRGEGPNWEGWPGKPLAVGSAMFVVGMLWETIAEVQRKVSKRNPENAGKPYTKGLFALSRHPNYAGYTLWRTGYAIACGGWIWGALSGGWFFYDFATRGVPVLEEYCETRVRIFLFVRHLHPTLTDLFLQVRRHVARLHRQSPLQDLPRHLLSQYHHDQHLEFPTVAVL